MQNIDPSVNSFSKLSLLLVKFRWLIILLFTFLGATTIKFSMNHYTDGGCQGGLCAFALIVHAFPSAAAWAFTLLAFLLINIATFFGGILYFLGVLINVGVFYICRDSDIDALYVPVLLLGFLQLGLYFIWKFLPNKNP